MYKQQRQQQRQQVAALRLWGHWGGGCARKLQGPCGGAASASG